MSAKTCPLCKKNLSLHQVNLNLAVYMCEDLSCKYPVGHNCIVVERNLEDIDKHTVELTSKDNNLDDWVTDVTTNEKKEPVSSVSIDLSATEEIQDQNPIGWIDDLVEEAVNEAQHYKSLNNKPEESNSDSVLDFEDFLNFL